MQITYNHRKSGLILIHKRLNSKKSNKSKSYELSITHTFSLLKCLTSPPRAHIVRSWWAVQSNAEVQELDDPVKYPLECIRFLTSEESRKSVLGVTGVSCIVVGPAM